MTMITVATVCPLCKREVMADVLEEDLLRYNSGEGLVQECFPYLSAGLREALFLTGFCEDCFDRMFSEVEED